MPNLEVMEFIGREEEVAYIDDLIKYTHTLTVLFLRGEGGLGKTRLLQEIHKAYVSKSEFLTTPIIDFDDRSLRTFERSEIRIAEELGIVAKEIQKLRRFQSAGASKEFLEAQQQVITNVLKSRFKYLSKNKRILFFFDTVEKVEERQLKNLLSLLSNFESGVFLFAGRPFAQGSKPKIDIAQIMKDQFGEDVNVIDVKPLDKDKSGEYLRKKLRTLHNIKGEWIQNLLILVKGRPILIELTAEWLSIVPQPEWLLNSLTDKDLVEKQKDFEANLVRHITQLRTPLDRLLLVLSRIYPVDVEMAKELLGLSTEEAKLLIESAKKYVFVKTLPGGKITLHDEMRKMVNELVWPLIDKTDERKRRDSKIATAIFERRVNNPTNSQQNEEDEVRSAQYAEEWRRIEQEVLIEQWVEHALYADINSGFEVFYQAWNEARRGKDYFFAGSILEIAHGHSDQFDNEQQFDFSVMDARQKNDTGNVEDSIKVLRGLAKQHAKEPSYLSEIYNALGRAERKSGSMKDAVTYLSKNLEIIKGTNPSLVPYVANQLGYTYRLMGNLNKAKSTYQYGLDLAMEAEEPDKDLIASLSNNLGYVFGLQKKYDVAENYCFEAEKLWKEVGLTSQIGRVNISLGIFHRDRGNYEEALRLFDQAIVLAPGSDDFEIIGLAYCHLAWAKLFKWEEINKTAILDWDETKGKDNFINKELLIEAKNDFDYCLTLAEERGLAELLPAILHQMSNVYWWLGWLEDERYKSIARAYNTRSFEESKQRDNFRYAIDSLVGKAEFDYDAGDYNEIPIYAKELQTRYRRMEKQHLLYFGRMDRILGDIAFNRSEYDEALNYYTDALPEIQKHGGYGKYSTSMELLRLERKLDKLPLSEVNMWLKHFQDHWKKRAELIHWCEKEQRHTKLRKN